MAGRWGDFVSPLPTGDLLAVVTTLEANGAQEAAEEVQEVLEERMAES